jgi:hypothetical protein
MMSSISSAATPCVFGGSSCTRHPRYVVDIGVTHSGSKSCRSAAVIVPPRSRESARIALAVAPS